MYDHINYHHIHILCILLLININTYSDLIGFKIGIIELNNVKKPHNDFCGRL